MLDRNRGEEGLRFFATQRLYCNWLGWAGTVALGLGWDLDMHVARTGSLGAGESGWAEMSGFFFLSVTRLRYYLGAEILMGI